MALPVFMGLSIFRKQMMQSGRALLARMPFLPYTVILKDGFAKVAADELLKEKDFGEHAIPVVSLETVLSEEEPVEKSRLLFAGKGSSFYLDENSVIK